MENFEATHIWSAFLGEQQSDSYAVSRSRLKNAFLNARDKAGLLLQEIPRTIPYLTVHDLTHIDALWDMADLIIGDELLKHEKFLNPLEVFVVGMSFLTHDLAHSLAALPISEEELHKRGDFRDILSSIVSSSEPSNSSAVPTDSQVNTAVGLYLRENHAEIAEGLLTRSWKIKGQDVYLLEDADLRLMLAEPIGRVAASHHWPVNKLPVAFPTPLGCPSFLNLGKCSCDLLKLACILRLADAAHLDGRRAPFFLEALRRPTGESLKHWTFQSYLNKPERYGDRIRFTSGHSFGIEEKEAWWLAFDTLRYLDSELSAVDSMRADLGADRFAIRSVVGSEDPKRLASHIPTKGWIPVDTQIRVGNVADLVLRLGGQELYGEKPYVPLRELVQNGSDAIRARRILEGRNNTWGRVDVAIFKSDETSWILQVTDNGVGMTDDILTGPLLDFGTSYWKSDQARKEFPGLSAAGFASTGQYGIGFFSVFMLGEKIKVISRRYDRGKEGTRVLEFSRGPNSRPILRNAKDSEQIEPGTRVEIVLSEEPFTPTGLLSVDGRPTMSSLPEFFAWLFPTSEVDIYTKLESRPYTKAIAASDWLTISNEELARRVFKSSMGGESEYAAIYESYIKDISPNIRNVLTKDNQIVGRAALSTNRDLVYTTDAGAGSITVGGARCDEMMSILGVLIGVSTRAARDAAKPNLDQFHAIKWMNEQVHLLQKSSTHSPEELSSAAAYAYRVGSSTALLPVARMRDGWVTIDEFITLAKSKNEIFLVEEYQFRDLEKNRKLNPKENVFVVDSHSGYLFRGHFLARQVPDIWKTNGLAYEYLSLRGLVVTKVAECWNIPIEGFLQSHTRGLLRGLLKFETEIADGPSGETVSSRVTHLSRKRINTTANN